MSGGVRDVWVYLAATPLLWLTFTLAAYLAGMWIYGGLKLNPLANPVLIAIVIVVAVLIATDTSYDTYFEGAQFVHFLLGPATVALAIPLYRQVEMLRRHAPAILASIAIGSAAAVVSAVGVAWLFGGSPTTLLSIAPKSVTAPIAMALAEQIGGLPSLTAVLVVLTGITGAMLGPPVLNLLGITDWAARGLAIGTAAHGIGTARAVQVNEAAGAFAGLAMGLNGVLTAILLPLLWRLLT
jgi:predicted murein hydrolase (TIGR00659 family)